jgi:hypothetical protein
MPKRIQHVTKTSEVREIASAALVSLRPKHAAKT